MLPHQLKQQRRAPIPPLDTDPNTGLTEAQAQARLNAGLDNRPTGRILKSEGRIIAENCLTFFNLLFTVMAAFLILLGSSVIKLTFLVVVIINTCIGCVQEIRAKRAVEKLTLMTRQTLRTLRDGKICVLPSHLLVRDDIVEFAAGHQICADGILRTGQLWVNEALVTGEADAIVKNPGDRLLSGSFAVAGAGRARLTAVGNEAFANRLAAEAKKDTKASKSEMMRALDRLIKVMGVLIIPIGALLFWQEHARLGLSLQASAEATAAALVGMIPEGLYLLTSIALAASALRLAKRRVLVQDMHCIETLARVDVLCLDKTGTITQPEMAVEKVIPLPGCDPTYLETVLTAMYGVRPPENDTGKALFEHFRGQSPWTCTQTLPFTSETKWSAAVFEHRGAFLTGAPERIMGDRYPRLQSTVTPWAQQGMRVLLVAAYDGIPDPQALCPDKVTPLGLVLLTNPIRPEAAQTFAYFKAQGVQIKVISGDDPQTVSQVAQKAGIEHADAWVDAATLETDEALAAAAERYTVFGRVTPAQKRMLCRALKRAGHTVAMTGDGVNDLLAMKEADCAIAMASGAQAASQVARLVLLDSDFSAMPHIVAEGRRVIGNIQRSASLFLVKNIFSLGLTLLSFLTGYPYPLEPQHMSIISGLTIGVPSFFLAMEPNHTRVTGRFLPGVLRRALPGGVTDILAVLGAQVCMAAFSLPLEQVSTLCTALLALTGMLVLYRVCTPFRKFRAAVFFAMTVALVGCFTLLGGIFELYITDTAVWLTLLTLLTLTPVIFFTLSRLLSPTPSFLLSLRGAKRRGNP